MRQPGDLVPNKEGSLGPRVHDARPFANLRSARVAALSLLASLALFSCSACQQDSKRLVERARVKFGATPEHLAYQGYQVGVSADSAAILLHNRSCVDAEFLCIGAPISSSVTTQAVAYFQDRKVQRWTIDRQLAVPLRVDQVSAPFEEQWGKPTDRNPPPAACAPIGMKWGVLTLTPIGTWHTAGEAARVYVLRGDLHLSGDTTTLLHVSLSIAAGDECKSPDSTDAMRQIRP